jgi:hypothetical protein
VIAWIIVAGRLPYIAATFADETSAKTHLASLPVAVRERAQLSSRRDVDNPCFVVEDRSGFQFLNEQEVVAYSRLALETGDPDEEGQYAILYTLGAPYLPRVPGCDEMGALPHTHLEYESLERIMRSGRTDP